MRKRRTLTNVARPCSTPATMRGEVVVEQHEVRRLAGDVGAGPAHRDADVGLVQGGTVVDAVAGHRHDVSPGAQGPGDAQLVLGRRRARRRCRHGRAARRAPGRRRAAPRPTRTEVVGCRSPTSVGDGGGRRRVVAGDHGDLDAGPAAGGERLADLRRAAGPPGRPARELELPLGLVRRRCRCVSPSGPAGDRKHPQAAAVNRRDAQRLGPEGHRTAGRTLSERP